MKKKIIVSLIFSLLIIFFGFWSIVSGGYDKQNKFILFLKEIIPSSLAKKVRDTVFIIPDLKERNKFLSIQVEKYEQGYDGRLFNKQNISSKKNNEVYSLKEFFLPFPRLDTRLGWKATENSKRAHYIEIIGDKVFAVSGLGETIYFNLSNLNSQKLEQKKINNNIDTLLSNLNAELIGIRDLFYDNQFLYISLQHKDKNGYTIGIYRAPVNYKRLEFEKFFSTNEYWDNYNVFSGGRLEKFSDNKIIFTIGFANKHKKSQQKKSLLGKIISIDKETKDHKLISYGHRNPQGLFYHSDLKIIMNTEHGPKGGDEVNFNFLDEDRPKNFGWPISSYGEPYPGYVEVFKKNGWMKTSHKENGFVEPVKQFTPSIGISELFYVKNNSEKKHNLFVSSLRAGSIYILTLDETFKKVLDEDRLYFPNKRIRDLKYDKKNNQFLFLSEYTPSIAVLKKKTK